MLKNVLLKTLLEIWKDPKESGMLSHSNIHSDTLTCPSRSSEDSAFWTTKTKTHLRVFLQNMECSLCFHLSVNSQVMFLHSQL